MKTHARAVVIGGGIAGCSILCHLTRLGWQDVVLVEKGELTSGTTWHSVGNTPVFTTSLNIMRLLQASNELYASLEQETGQSVGYHRVGSLRLASSRQLLDWYKHIAAMARLIDVRFEILSPSEAKELNPFLNTDGLVGASFVDCDGYLDPSSVTQALAAGARQRGAEIYRHTRVEHITREPGGEWKIKTDQGDIRAEILVNTAGQWGREIAHMVGADVPLVPMEHQYVVTEGVPSLKSLSRELPLTRDPERAFYLRQEAGGLLIGFFEHNPIPWAVDGIPRDFDQQLLKSKFEQIESYMEAAIERMPILGRVGIKKIVNGPDAYTPDGRPIMGFVPGVQNVFVLAGFSCFGIANSGGAGKFAAEWIVEGQPSVDMWEYDVRRFGPYATTKKYLVDKACEVYGHEYSIHYPHQERPAGRPLKTSPIYDQLKAQGAVFQARHGWERATWFAPRGVEPRDELTFYRANWFPYVGAECRAVRERVGVLDQTSFGKFEVAGPGATAFLEKMCANRIAGRLGKIVVTEMLNPRGGIECDLTVTQVAPDVYWIITAAATTTHDYAWIQWHLPNEGSVTLRDITHEHGCLSLMGPQSREVLSSICDEDVSNAAFPFLTTRDLNIGLAPVRAFRVSYVGELGWELYHPIEYQRTVYEQIMDAGRAHDIVNYGYRALDSLRLEKAYRFWGFDLNSLTTPFEAGLGQFVKLDKGDFIGREALIRQKQSGLERVLVCLTVEQSQAIPHGWEPILDSDKPIGYVTSGEYGHCVNQAMALAFVPPEYSSPGQSLTIQILGEPFLSKVVQAPLYDPQNLKLKQS